METLDKVTFLEIIKYLTPQEITDLCVENNKFKGICHNDPRLWSQLLQERFPLAQRYNLDPQTEFLINARQTTVYNADVPKFENDLLSNITVYLGEGSNDHSISTFEISGLRPPSGTKILLACFESPTNTRGGRRIYSVYSEPIFRKEDIIEDLTRALKNGQFKWNSGFIDMLLDDVKFSTPDRNLENNKLLTSVINDLETKNFTVIHTAIGTNLFYIVSVTLP